MEHTGGPLPPADPDQPADRGSAADPAFAGALARWGVAAGPLERLSGGAANEHWRVGMAERPLVLRRYHHRRDRAAVAYEHRLLRFLAERDWPVAAPLPAADGATAVEEAGALWALFPFLPGEPAPDDLLHLQRKGALLALLHADLAEWPEEQQRPGAWPVADLDAWVAAAARPPGPAGATPRAGASDGAAVGTAEELFAWLATADPARAAALREARVRNREELDRLDYGRLVDTTVYAECAGANVLFRGDTVTALLDFDSAYRDARIADVARSLVIDCGPDARRVSRWVGGYAAHADPRLLAIELDLLPAVMVASELWNIVVPLAEAAGRGESPAQAVVPAATAIDVGLPALIGAATDIRRAARRAAHPANRTPPPGA